MSRDKASDNAMHGMKSAGGKAARCLIKGAHEY